MEANTAALGYLKCALLFFASLLITVSVIPTLANFLVEIANESRGIAADLGVFYTPSTASSVVRLERRLLMVALEISSG